MKKFWWLGLAGLILGWGIAIYLLSRFPQKSGLQVITNEVTTSLFLDGNYLDKTPFINKNIKPGTYTLKLEPDDANLAPFETTITLNPGLLTVMVWKSGVSPELSGGVIYEMKKSADKKGSVNFMTIPDGAIIAWNSGDQEFAPLVKNNLDSGQYDFEVSLPSYETQKHNLNVSAGYQTDITIKLAKNLSLETPKSTPAPSSQPSSPSAVTSALVDQAAVQNLEPAKPYLKIKATNLYINDREVLRVRKEASSSSPEIGLAQVGQNYPFAGEKNPDWYQIKLGDQIGWVSSKYATLVE